jgi:trans-AT polyketide synthase/acyltransferase/oxidoreductase domain-containing protein
VVERGNLMAGTQGGSMVVVLGVGAGQIRGVLAQHGLDGIDLAGYNTPTQTVISGQTPEMERAVEILSAARILTAPLNVSAACHSRQMRGAQLRFAKFASAFELTEPDIPVVANATARPYEPGHILQTLIAQMAAPVLWTDSVRYLLRQGRVEFTEIGTSVLTKMVREIARAPV